MKTLQLPKSVVTANVPMSRVRRWNKLIVAENILTFKKKDSLCLFDTATKKQTQQWAGIYIKTTNK